MRENFLGLYPNVRLAYYTGLVHLELGLLKAKSLCETATLSSATRMARTKLAPYSVRHQRRAINTFSFARWRDMIAQNYV